MSKIYVASSWRNNFQQDVVEGLRRAGHEVYDFKNPPHGRGGFAWSDIDPNWEGWSTKEYILALQHSIAEDGFNSDFDGMKWADVCVMVLPCGRSANTEAGWMKGAGKKVFVLSPIKQEPELMYKIYDGIYATLPELMPALDAAPPPPSNVGEIEVPEEVLDWTMDHNPYRNYPEYFNSWKDGACAMYQYLYPSLKEKEDALGIERVMKESTERVLVKVIKEADAAQSELFRAKARIEALERENTELKQQLKQ